MPLHQINVSPIDSNKSNENRQSFESQMPVRMTKSQESCGRCESQASSQSSSNTEICRICHCEGDTETSLIAPCYCSGSLRFVHQVCLQQWIKSSNIRCCELCKFQFIMHTKTKPFMEWEPLEMTGFERRKLLCAVMFHIIALTCVVWSLYVLIDRTAEEIKLGLLEWPFWTKLIVVAVGFTGGVVFMYIQCKAYMQICQRWKAFNRVIYVQNAPEKQPLPSPICVPPVAVHPINGGASAEGSRQDVKVRPQESNFKEETSIDLKGIRNVHIFFNDENRVCVQNEQKCIPEPSEGTSEGNNSSNLQRGDEMGASWHIKIGKGSGNESASATSLRCNELENMLVPTESHEQRSSKSEDHTKCSDMSSANIGDSVLKLQIKKAEIVIKFGQKSSAESSGEDVINSEGKDTSVNIKIDDKESEPIVIDVVKKAPTEPKDPVQICFGFGPNDQEKGCDSDESLNGAGTKLLELNSQSNDNFSHYETDSGSQSPLLSSKNAHFQPN